jgi:3-methylfumaryl-CoA hydratase
MLNVDELRTWVGRTETAVERIAAFPSQALAATLDRDDPVYADGTALPPLWHWLHFLNVSPLRAAGPDGHPARGGFLPPVPLPRRMWAGSRLEFLKPLRIGQTARKTSTIRSVEHKSGRSGELVFVTVRHEYAGDAGLAISDEHDIVYREAAAPGAAAPAPPKAREDGTLRRSITPDPVLLFRYSALTFNSHRIHYDKPYVTGEEGYPGLVVHGPLIATLLLDLLRREMPAATVKSFAFRAVSPLFAGSAGADAPAHRFEVRGKPNGKVIDLWAVNPGGAIAMDGKAVIA